MTTSLDNTATTKGARDHARAQADRRVDGMPTVPATAWPAPPTGVPADALTWAETVPGGRYTVKALARGTRLRLTDLTGTACASVLLWRTDAPWERLSLADTVKVPWQAYLGAGHPLLSDQGRVLATIVADDSGHHDAICGTTTLAQNTAKYGAGEAHSDSPAGRELLVLAAAKHGLTPTDVAPTVSFFHGVRVEDDGALTSTGSAGAGHCVDLVLHLPCIVAVANTAHPLDPSPTFDTGMLELMAWHADDDLQALIDDTTVDPEYRRAVANSEDAHHAARSIR
ncbi:Urea carboxylase-associated protein 2 OS=Tsukamurella paurometabola (strain ATCC 8368 / DSM/ CCUG 35730 / CIP 100753 / JCM 10117 / KCTC 9821 / NBRC 16120/ NCIMB 702349 / NCTC 13040) OX=521096 GN=Tpau_1592 PE=4 SV=1 [Tsukamurella paurometabola]|uniref:Urea carboxylase-associated protein 2 n=1 Tax=Tsukamurella paurometabola (strain ATCC 8368 / DSM 20162 / CCUG 35730 / CIP 100753 / JCM 10117 / KCTC 9821 / NBRC 16120 / NCIMB 702349 / NCTC 13040) TaxID=521096 RepID=D5UYA6_TSUPD|nr:urea amidolyase associated protein UAAP1 [Tsukamurella paurometabola]ADG78213.1 urea carboxylase-associated protein 2 [Tsukamurella paurometabola DSM 20162]SUP30699.1 urea carboxylase-associated protein 2 [Tsukamurella paurometabola]